MRFTDLQFAALQAASADPRTSPATVPDSQIVTLGATLPGTDNAPPYVGLVLEGTATQTMDVTLWAKLEPANNLFSDAPEAGSARLFYQVGAKITLTVGIMKTLPAVQGPFYLQTGAAPAAASVLRVAGMAVAIP